MFVKLWEGGGLYRKNKIYEHISQQQMQNTVKKERKKRKRYKWVYILSILSI